MALFSQYAIAAAEEALKDAEWAPTSDTGKERTGVCLGSGIGNFDDLYTTSLAFENKVPPSHPSHITQTPHHFMRATRKYPPYSSRVSSSIWQRDT